MAGRDHHHPPPKKNISFSSSCCTSFLFLSLLLVASLFLALSLFGTSLSLQQWHYQSFELPTEIKTEISSTSCDYSDGKWIYNPTARSARYDSACKEIYKGWSCIAGNKSNALDIIKWRWKPDDCDLPQFDPLSFLQLYRDTNIGNFIYFLSTLIFSQSTITHTYVYGSV